MAVRCQPTAPARYRQRDPPAGNSDDPVRPRFPPVRRQLRGSGIRLALSPQRVDPMPVSASVHSAVRLSRAGLPAMQLPGRRVLQTAGHLVPQFHVKRAPQRPQRHLMAAPSVLPGSARPGSIRDPVQLASRDHLPCLARPERTTAQLNRQAEIRCRIQVPAGCRLQAAAAEQQRLPASPDQPPTRPSPPCHCPLPRHLVP
jgi:hypothetical protein